MFRSYSFDADQRHLHFEQDDVVLINIGTTSKVIGIAIDDCNQGTAVSAERKIQHPILGPGDREFIQLARQTLSTDSAGVAEKLLLGVRQKSAGDLKRGQSRNFSETPDNFWYVIVQPRIDQLSLTVRGPLERFEGLTDLEVKDDRGNTRFKVRDERDVPKALKLIFNALRKRKA